MRLNFNLPDTKLCVVVWYRNGDKNETLIDTPVSDSQLQTTMLGHRVGLSEIRAIKAVEPLNLIGNAFATAFAKAN